METPLPQIYPYNQDTTTIITTDSPLYSNIYHIIPTDSSGNSPPPNLPLYQDTATIITTDSPLYSNIYHIIPTDSSGNSPPPNLPLYQDTATIITTDSPLYSNIYHIIPTDATTDSSGDILMGHCKPTKDRSTVVAKGCQVETALQCCTVFRFLAGIYNWDSLS